MEKKKLAILGCGKLAKIIATAVIDGTLPEYEIVVCMSRNINSASNLANYINQSKQSDTCISTDSIDTLLNSKPDYLIETAAPQAMRDFAISTLKQGVSIITLSIGAFADTNFYQEVAETARKHKAQVHIASGAIGGFDVLRTASMMGKSTVSFDTEKGPNSLKGTEVYDEALQSEKRMVFQGNAMEAIALFPTKVNVSVAASIASVGPENERVSVTSTPGFIGDTHRIELNNDDVRAVVEVYSRNADIAAWSVINRLRNLVSPIVF